MRLGLYMTLAIAAMGQSLGGCWDTCVSLSPSACIKRCTEEPMSLAEEVALRRHTARLSPATELVGEEAVALHQGNVLGNRHRCESICYNVCDSEACIASCTAKFCTVPETTQIMDSVGFSLGSGPIASSLVLFVVSLVSTAIAIRVIDSVGRRWLLLWTLFAQALSMLVMAAGMVLTLFFSLPSVGKWLCLVSLIAYKIALSFGSAPMMAIIAPELFPVRSTQLHLRSLGNSLGNTVNWISSALVGIAFLFCMESNAGTVGMWLFSAAVNAVCMIIIYVGLPETRGKALEEVRKLETKDA